MKSPSCIYQSSEFIVWIKQFQYDGQTYNTLQYILHIYSSVYHPCLRVFTWVGYAGAENFGRGWIYYFICWQGFTVEITTYLLKCFNQFSSVYWIIIVQPNYFTVFDRTLLKHSKYPSLVGVLSQFGNNNLDINHLCLFSLRPIKVPVPSKICLSFTVQQFLITIHNFYSVVQKNLVDT